MNRTRVQFLGRLVADPELLFTPTGEGVATFVLAVSPNGPAAGDEDAARHRCIAWNLGDRRLADLVVDHLHAGAVVYVEGRLQMPPRAETGQRIGRGGQQILFSDVQLF
ncbi:MAG: single-stranded DNA-binding protein [Candidatus Dormibacteraeota bacterium]|nr:single-stranded DNA-binding protein [Candidatus Dormibacteraeota bacterium]